MTDVGKFVVFKPVAGGYVYRRPTAWLFGSADHFLANEGQKAAILTILRSSTRAVLWTAGLSWFALSALSGTAVAVWARGSGHFAPGLDGVIAMLAMTFSIYPAFVISRHVMLHRLRPVLATLAPTNERITSLEERQAIQAIARTAAPISPLRRKIVRGAGAFTIAGTLGAMIARAVDMYDASQSKLLTLYLADANLSGLLNIVTIVAMGFLFVSFGRNSRRT